MITYSKILTNFDVIRDPITVKKLRVLDNKNLQGGFGAVLNYPDENPSEIVIAYDNGEPIGWVSVGIHDKSQNIYVNPKYRKTEDRVASTLKDIIYKRHKTATLGKKSVYYYEKRLFRPNRQELAKGLFNCPQCGGVLVHRMNGLGTRFECAGCGFKRDSDKVLHTRDRLNNYLDSRKIEIKINVSKIIDNVVKEGISHG